MGWLPRANRHPRAEGWASAGEGKIRWWDWHKWDGLGRRTVLNVILPQVGEVLTKE